MTFENVSMIKLQISLYVEQKTLLFRQIIVFWDNSRWLFYYWYSGIPSQPHFCRRRNSTRLSRFNFGMNHVAFFNQTFLVNVGNEFSTNVASVNPNPSKVMPYCHQQLVLYKSDIKQMMSIISTNILTFLREKIGYIVLNFLRLRWCTFSIVPPSLPYENAMSISNTMKNMQSRDCQTSDSHIHRYCDTGFICVKGWRIDWHIWIGLNSRIECIEISRSWYLIREIHHSELQLRKEFSTVNLLFTSKVINSVIQEVEMKQEENLGNSTGNKYIWLWLWVFPFN